MITIEIKPKNKFFTDYRIKRTAKKISKALFDPKFDIQIYILSESSLPPDQPLLSQGFCDKLSPDEHIYGVFVASEARTYKRNFTLILAHELSHVKQFVVGGLWTNNDYIVYESLVYSTKTLNCLPWQYRPWEMEAHRLTRVILKNEFNMSVPTMAEFVRLHTKNV